MKIGVISDIHCNAKGLLGALEGMADCDEVFCCGDAVYGFRFSNEVIEIMRTRGVIMVMGNHDRDFMRVWRERGGSNGQITPENLAYIEKTPFQRRLEIGGKRIWVTHGSPIEPYWEYVFPQSPRFQQFGELDTDFLLVGHTHLSNITRIGKVLVCNPGSAGESRDPQKPYLTYATIDLQSEEGLVHMIHEPDLSKPSFNKFDREALAKIPKIWTGPQDGPPPGALPASPEATAERK